MRTRVIAGVLWLGALAAVVVAVVVVLAARDGDKSAAGTTPAAAARPARACPAAWRATYQRLANRIHAPVYCPAWMPAPLTGEIGPHVSFGGAGGSSLSVDPDGSYLALFVWAEPGSGEVHVNLRGYPGRTTVPTCVKKDTNGSRVVKTRIPCFADPRGTVRRNGITATVYTVNQDADLWHVLYAWRYRGGLYTVSQHVAPPLSYQKVIASLDRILDNLVLVQPREG
ncbi:MAG TPA: hypothetical protein VFB26_06155 [Gaiellaceae bacterium]|nr:hypothetical protein [Gaiellaceae bacterium]